MADAGSLAGRRILVVEDEYLIAEEIAEALERERANVFGPVSTVHDAQRLALGTHRLDAALLDVNLRGEMIWPVADILLRRHVRLVLSTGYDVSTIPQAYVHLPRCEKPTTARTVVSVLAQVLTAAAPR